MEKTYLKKFVSYAAATAIAVSAFSVASPAKATTVLDATDATIAFLNTDTIYANPGESQLYEDVATVDGETLDAVVTVIEEFDDGFIEDLDYYDESDPHEPLDIDLFVDGPKGSVSFKIEFFLAGTDTQVTLENLDLNVKDIDTYQYIETENVSGYAFSQDTVLTALTHADNAEVQADHTRFQELNGLESEFEDQPHWVSIHFNSVTTFNFKVGQDVEGGAWFSLDFSKAAFDNPDNHGDTGDPEVPVALSKLTKTVFFAGDSAYLQPKWFKSLDKLIAKVPSCATNVTAKIYSGVKKAKSEVKGSVLAQRRAAIVQKFLTKRGLTATVSLVPNGKGTKALNKKRYAKVVIKYDGSNCN